MAISSGDKMIVSMGAGGKYLARKFTPASSADDLIVPALAADGKFVAMKASLATSEDDKAIPVLGADGKLVLVKDVFGWGSEQWYWTVMADPWPGTTDTYIKFAQRSSGSKTQQNMYDSVAGWSQTYEIYCRVFGVRDGVSPYTFIWDGANDQDILTGSLSPATTHRGIQPKSSAFAGDVNYITQCRLYIRDWVGVANITIRINIFWAGIPLEPGGTEQNMFRDNQIIQTITKTIANGTTGWVNFDFPV